MTPGARVCIGCAGWSIPRAEQHLFPGAGSHLERYASRFPAAEINSSFHRSHRVTTWQRWRDSVPEAFRFSVKMPKSITHVGRLQGAGELVANFLAEAELLGPKLGCILVQLPPSLAFDSAVVGNFFGALRSRTPLPIACEPRHPSWFHPAPNALLAGRKVARVAADPARAPESGEPGGWRGVKYHRLHGFPRIYYSAYDDAFIAALSDQIRRELIESGDVWCIFDNTTLGAATRNALELESALLRHKEERESDDGLMQNSGC